MESDRGGDQRPKPKHSVPPRQSKHTFTPYASMECERWLHARLDDLRMKSVLDQKTDVKIPQKLERNFVDFNGAERNIRGETLVISVIRYESDKANQIRYLNMLNRSGCDLSMPDSRQLRTPLMVACLMRNDAIAHYLITHNANLMAADRVGNTALMYAAMYSQSSLVIYFAEQLAKRWALEAFRAKNLMGYTAENLARKNERYMFSMMLKKQRLKIVKQLRDFVAANLIYAPEFDSWKRFVCIYKVRMRFLSLVQHEEPTPTAAEIIATPSPAETDFSASGTALPHLEDKSGRGSLSFAEGGDLRKWRSTSTKDLREMNLPKLPNKVRRRLNKANTTAKNIASGLSALCPHISVSSC